MALRIGVLYLVVLSFPLASCVQADAAFLGAPGQAVVAQGKSGQTDMPRALQDGPHDFGWRLSGDRSSAPLQVFSSPRGVWLQFSGRSPLPAVFGLAPGGREVLLPITFLPPYAFVAGQWSGLTFRAGARRAQAIKVRGAYPAEQSGLQSDIHVAKRPDPVAGNAARTPPGRSQQFEVQRNDRNLRRVLVRWAELAGWTFEPEHWTLEADIPVSAEARLGQDFRSAVRGLMAATEMGDMPAQPCFYANKVLRVVGYAQACDPRRPTPATARVAGAL